MLAATNGGFGSSALAPLTLPICPYRRREGTRGGLEKEDEDVRSLRTLLLGPTNTAFAAGGSRGRSTSLVLEKRGTWAAAVRRKAGLPRGTGRSTPAPTVSLPIGVRVLAVFTTCAAAAVGGRGAAQVPGTGTAGEVLRATRRALAHASRPWASISGPSTRQKVEVVSIEYPQIC